MENKDNTYNTENLWSVIKEWELETQSVFSKYIAGYSIEEIATHEGCLIDDVLRTINKCKERLIAEK